MSLIIDENGFYEARVVSRDRQPRASGWSRSPGPLQLAGDLPDAMPLGTQQRDLLPLHEQQVPPRRRL
jgi:hypothetical protein